jgi:hypothetical protein
MSEYRRLLAYRAGRKAALNRRDRSTCKRTPGTIYFDDWHDGFDELRPPSGET